MDILRVLVPRGCACDDGEADNHASRREQEHLASSYHIVAARSDARSNPSRHGVDAVKELGHRDGSNAHGLDHRGEVVTGDVISRELHEPGPRNDEQHPVSPRTRLEQRLEVEIVARRTDAAPAQGLLDLTHLYSDDRMVGVTVGMVLNQECACFFVTALGDEPSWALRDEPGAENDEARADGLQPQGQAPLDVAIEMEVATVDGFI